MAIANFLRTMREAMLAVESTLSSRSLISHIKNISGVIDPLIEF